MSHESFAGPQFPAHVILSGTKSLDDMSGYYDSTEQMWDTKLQESLDSGLADSIQSEGVKEPVGIAYYPSTGESVLEDGHHRLITAVSLDPDMKVPVRWLPPVPESL